MYFGFKKPVIPLRVQKRREASADPVFLGRPAPAWGGGVSEETSCTSVSIGNGREFNNPASAVVPPQTFRIAKNSLVFRKFSPAQGPQFLAFCHFSPRSRLAG